jgi:zinc protease
MIPTPAFAELEIPFEKFSLDNGLTVIVHEDHAAPIVAAHVWYHVGSKDERPGRTGFAHLFEHLMFNGSENLDQDWFMAMEEAGATGLNGTTNWDRTNYFQTVPTAALDRTLWMESDRMGHLLGVVSQEKLDEQRGVVQNEKRQRENSPYGQAWNWLSRGSFPADHPYSWPVIGNMEDLDAASLEDVRTWFQSYYGPSNAVLVLAGDIDVETARQKAEKYFGDIPAGPPLLRHDRWVAKRTGDRRQVAHDRVPQSRLYEAWNTSELGTADATQLELLAQILGGDKNSRLYKRVVHEDQLATSVSAYYFGRELAGWFVIQADARPGVALQAVEKAVDEEVARLLTRGPTREELDRARTTLRADFLRSLERVGGFHGVAGVLASGEVYEGDPDAYRRWLADLAAASPSSLREAGQRWLSDGAFALEIHPFPAYAHADAGADRSQLPGTGEPSGPGFPILQRATLDNGLRVILAERHDLPLVEAELLVDAGYASDTANAGKLGTSSYALAMMKEGTEDLGALELSAQEAKLGATIKTRSTLDTSSISLSALRENLDPSLALFADVVREPVFAPQEIERKRKRWLARILQEKSEPRDVALRTLPPLLYGADHAYGIPFTGSGTEASITSLTRDDLVNFHRRWIRPDAATLIVVGDVDMPTLLPLLQKYFGNWKAPEGPRAEKRLPTVPAPPKSSVYLVDKPGAEQSVIIVGHVTPPVDIETYDAIELMNNILGGSFTSRLNMNLREDKHWSYGARTRALDAAGQRPFFAYAPVQSDRTADSMTEILREFREYRSVRPATQAETQRAIEKQIRTLPGRFETNREVLAAIADIVRFDWPDDTVSTTRDRLEGLGPKEIHATAQAILRPEQLTWVVVGDLAQIEAPVRELDFGKVTILDADGAVLR